MPPKTSSASRRPAAPRKKEKDGPIEIVVRRGSLRRFDALKTRTADLPVVVTWDRRLKPESAEATERRRRYSERRRTPPFTWELADFVVVETPKKRKPAVRPAGKASARKRKKTSKKS